MSNTWALLLNEAYLECLIAISLGLKLLGDGQSFYDFLSAVFTVLTLLAICAYSLIVAILACLVVRPKVKQGKRKLTGFGPERFYLTAMNTLPTTDRQKHRHSRDNF